jgi:hypothetical protein
MYSRHLECFYGRRGTAPRHGNRCLFSRRHGLPEAKSLSCSTKTVVVMLKSGSSRTRAVRRRVWTSTGTLECWRLDGCLLAVNSAAVDAPPNTEKCRGVKEVGCRHGHITRLSMTLRDRTRPIVASLAACCRNASARDFVEA